LRTETLTESHEGRLRLSPDEADALRETGFRLASKWVWWGETEPPERTVIQVRPIGGDEWSIRVADAVGVIVVGSLQLLVQPKIPPAHLLYLFEHSRRLPRLDIRPARVAAGESLWSLVAASFLTATEAVIRRDLVRDYQPKEQDLAAARGQVNPLRTATAFYSGRTTMHCRFSEFGIDTPLNRVLKAAAREVVSSHTLDWSLRQRSLRVLSRLADIGDLQRHDCHVTPDRRTGHYTDAITLAIHILRGVGRALGHGVQSAWAFLIRTPEMVEDGVRAVLDGGLGAGHVQKRGIRLTDSTLTFNPDLLFDNGRAVADVKYKLSGGAWDRSDLFQVIAFAEAFRARDGAIVRFRSPGTRTMSTLVVGDKRIAELTWPADERVDPAESAAQLVAATRAWLAALSTGA
jgi:5-methylcytosine-specific restriction enzyme subunit McrC